MHRHVIYFMLLTFLVSCSPFSVSEEDKKVHKQATQFFEPIEPTLIDLKKFKKEIDLGRTLYHEKKLSRSGTISCSSCHSLDSYGVDNLPTSPGHNDINGDRNSPTVFNAGLNFKQFWDGRAKDLAEQALGPLTNPVEHGLSNEEEIIAILKDNDYEEKFDEAYETKGALTIENVTNAIASFEKTLMTPSRFDKYLQGNIKALSKKERKGLSTFMQVGCTQCHSGAGLGGTTFQKMGLVKEYETSDLGLYDLTGKNRDKKKFKVPLLRNIEKTAPYLHDGSIETLEEVVAIMGEYQLGRELSEVEISDIVAFLNSTTGELANR